MVVHFIRAEDAAWLVGHFAFFVGDTGWAVPEWVQLIEQTILPKGLSKMATVKPKQETLPDGRKALWFNPAPAYLVKSAADPEYFTLLYAGEECAGLSKRSDDVMFLEAVENKLREHGHAMHYPAESDHVWLDESQFELAPIPADWKLFFDETSGVTLQRDRFYGFGDAGGVTGSPAGYVSREAALADIRVGYGEDDQEFGTLPEHLGDHAVTVLSGEELVNHLQTLDGEGAHFYGKFVG